MSTTTLQAVEETVEQLNTDNEQGTLRVFKKIMSRCLLVSMTFSRWRGAYQIEKAEVTTEGKTVPQEISTPGRWKLVPESFNKKLQALESEARALLSKYSVPFSMPGVYIIPLDSADALFQRLQVVRTKLEEEADNLCSPENYALLLSQLHSAVNGDEELYQVACKFVPSREDMRKKFGMCWPIVPIGAPNEEFADSPSEFIKEARAETAKMVKDAIDTLLNEPRKEFADALDNLNNILLKNLGNEAKNGGVRQASIDSVRNALAKLRSFEFVADNELLKQMSSLDDVLKDTTPKKLNSSMVTAKALSVTLNTIANKARDDDASVQKFDRFSRSLDFEEN